MRQALHTALVLVLCAALCSAQWGMMGEMQDIMSNCRFEGGYCIDVNRAHATGSTGEPAEPGEAPAPAPAPQGRAGGRRAGPNPLGRAHVPPTPGPMQQMNVLHRECASVDMDVGCWRTGGYCCTPWP